MVLLLFSFFAARRRAIPAELAAKPPQRFLLTGAEAAHFRGDGASVRREDTRDEPAPGGCKLNLNFAPVILLPYPADPAVLFQIVYDERNVAPASQELLC